MVEIIKHYLVFLADETVKANAKTAFGVHDWLPDSCVGQWKMPLGSLDLGVPDLVPEEAYQRGARSLLIGIASRGGQIPEAWISYLLHALDAGLDIVSGMHSRLSDISAIREKASRLGLSLHDLRHNKVTFSVATGEKRKGKRVLTVGTDCAIGKKYAALSITREACRRGLKANFRATGQTGIMIAGGGVAVDAVVADFIAGAAEWLTPDNESDHWDIIEGQGSLFNPSYAGVTLGLVHGSQADAMVLCHDPNRSHINGLSGYPIPELTEAMDLYLRTGRLTNRAVRFIGVALNTSGFSDDARQALFDKTEKAVGLPCFDPLIGGVEKIVDEMERL